MEPVLIRNLKASERRRISGPAHRAKLNNRERAQAEGVAEAVAEQWFIDEMESDERIFLRQPLTSEEPLLC